MFKTKKEQSVAPLEGERFTSGDVARIAGVSLRQLQWWDERNVVHVKIGYRASAVRCDVIHIDEHERWNPGDLLGFDMFEVHAGHVLQYEGGAAVFLHEADLDIVQLNAFGVADEKAIGGEHAE